MALGLAVLGLLFLALGFFWPRALFMGGGAFLLAGGVEAWQKGPFLTPAQLAFFLASSLAFRTGSLYLRPRLAPLRRYLHLLAFLLALFGLKALPHPGMNLPWGLAFLHAGSFLVAYLALGVGVGAGVLGALQDRRLRRSPHRALRSSPLWSLRRLERGYLGVGYLALTFGLASGIAWAFSYFGQPLSLDPKEAAVLGSWLLFTLYFLLEERLDWPWRPFLLGFGYLVFLFAFLLAPFLGSRHPSSF